MDIEILFVLDYLKISPVLNLHVVSIFPPNIFDCSNHSHLAKCFLNCPLHVKPIHGLRRLSE